VDQLSPCVTLTRVRYTSMGLSVMQQPAIKRFPGPSPSQKTRLGSGQQISFLSSLNRRRHLSCSHFSLELWDLSEQLMSSQQPAEMSGDHYRSEIVLNIKGVTNPRHGSSAAEDNYPQSDPSLLLSSLMEWCRVHS